MAESEIETTELGDLEAFVVRKCEGDAKLIEALGGAFIFADAEKPTGNGGRKAILVFTITPLDDAQGQTRRRNSKALVDLKLIIDGPPTDETERAAARIDVLFKYVVKETEGNHSFSTRRVRAIRYREPVANDERGFYHRGGSYRAVITRRYEVT